MKKVLVSLGFSAMLLLPVGWSVGAVHVLSDSEMQNAVGSYNQDGECDSADGCTLPTPTAPTSCNGSLMFDPCGNTYSANSASTCDSLSLSTLPPGCYTTSQPCYVTYAWHCDPNSSYNPGDPNSGPFLICTEDTRGTNSAVTNSVCRMGQP
jgi:hypothetical protein